MKMTWDKEHVEIVARAAFLTYQESEFPNDKKHVSWNAIDNDVKKAWCKFALVILEYEPSDKVIQRAREVSKALHG